MGVDVSERREQPEAEAAKANKAQQHEPTPARQSAFGVLGNQLRSGWRELQWGPILLFGVAAGVLMTFSFLRTNILSFVAGIIPVGTGLLLGRRVKGHYGLHGFMTGLIGALASIALLAALIFFTPLGQNAQSTFSPNVQITPTEIFLQLGGFIAFSLITFCTFGASMAGRTEERNRKVREEIAARGGSLQRPGVIRTPDDIRGLSLPQFGSYVNNLFKKHGFKFKDYRFIDKDKHLDLWMEYENEPWHLRLSVADKISPGTVEGLNQELKREGCRKGVVITSTEFMPSAVKSAKGRPIVLIDGQTLYEIAEK